MSITALRYEDLEIIKKLGSGSQGGAYLVALKTTQEKFTLKKEECFSEEDKARVNMEIEQMKRLTSKFTVHFITAFQRDLDLCIIMKYCEGGDLRKVIHDFQELAEKERFMACGYQFEINLIFIERVWEILAQIVRALDFMHSQGVVHRDIKPENIFVNSDGSVCLGDFGLAKVISSKDYATMAGTKVYMAAEVWQSKKTDFASDIFSVGIVAVELLTGRHPFEAGTEQGTIDNIIKGNAAPLPEQVSREMKELVTSMISHDALKRPTAKEILEQETIQMFIRQQEEKEKKTEELQKIANDKEAEIARLRNELEKHQIQNEIQNKTNDPEIVEEKEQKMQMHRKTMRRQRIGKQQSPQEQLSGSIQTQKDVGTIAYIHLVPYSEDVDIKDGTFSGSSDKNSVILFNPALKSGIVKFEVLNLKDATDIGIADESVQYSRNQYPKQAGNGKIVYCSSSGTLFHQGDLIGGNSKYKSGDRIAMELNMDSNPKSLTFFINDVEQPNYITNIPATSNIYQRKSSFKIVCFDLLTSSTAKHEGSRAWGWGTIMTLVLQLQVCELKIGMAFVACWQTTGHFQWFLTDKCQLVCHKATWKLTRLISSFALKAAPPKLIPALLLSLKKGDQSITEKFTAGSALYRTISSALKQQPQEVRLYLPNVLPILLVLSLSRLNYLEDSGWETLVKSVIAGCGEHINGWRRSDPYSVSTASIGTGDKKKKTGLPPIQSPFQSSHPSLPPIANYGFGCVCIIHQLDYSYGFIYLNILLIQSYLHHQCHILFLLFVVLILDYHLERSIEQEDDILIDFDAHASANLPRPQVILSRLITCLGDISFDCAHVKPILVFLTSVAPLFHYSMVDVCSDRIPDIQQYWREYIAKMPDDEENEDKKK
ncbi:MAG: putative Serine/threonine-protein kinase Nek3 [Streblomastix strix]|uniref:non-specific serine/threonine protein kinase n=1 Tax=Streblomastix strix TaxID=222440 RepID=A0A5J4WU76_9EUKA|nr:MAG: putative Serine/threonine-protein kinase Nek3 [Streblomastix strix]